MSHSPLAPNPGPCPRRLPCETSSLSPFSASSAIPPATASISHLSHIPFLSFLPLRLSQTLLLSPTLPPFIHSIFLSTYYTAATMPGTGSQQ